MNIVNMQLDMNLLAIVAGAISSMVVGSLWYSPIMFAKPWMKLAGVSDSNMRGANMGMFFTQMFIISLIQAYVLFNFERSLGVIAIHQALQLVFWVWLGFTAMTMAANYIAGKKPKNLYLIDAGYHLVNLAVMSVVILKLS